MADLMQAASLTHSGLTAILSQKDDLVAEATAASVDAITLFKRADAE